MEQVNNYGWMYREEATPKSITRFELSIHEFCDYHIGEKVLFTFFMSLWPFEDVDKEGELRIFTKALKNKDIAVFTSRVLAKLLRNNVLTEVDMPLRTNGEYQFLLPKGTIRVPYFSGHPYYEILPHEPLVERKR